MQSYQLGIITIYAIMQLNVCVVSYMYVASYSYHVNIGNLII